MARTTMAGEGRVALNHALKSLRYAWPPTGQWPGLPQVMVGVLRHLLSLHPLEPLVLTHRMETLLAMAGEVEQLGARVALKGLEPAYHNRLHTADTLVSLACLLRAQRQTELNASVRLSRQEWQMLMAMTAHDVRHDGSRNASPGQLERRSAQAASHWLRLWGVGAQDRQAVQALILATDPARVAELRLAWRRLGCPAELKNSHYRALLLTEADVMASALPNFGRGLTQALYEEWRNHSPGPARALLSRAGRTHFLAQVAVFISPAARQLGMVSKPR